MWREVWRHLEPLHARYACAAYRSAAAKVALSRPTHYQERLFLAPDWERVMNDVLAWLAR